MCGDTFQNILPQLEGSHGAKEKVLAKANALFSEQIAMRAGSSQRQDKSIALNLVDEEPIRLDVAFPERLPISGQRVIFVFGIQLCLVGQASDDSVEQIRVKMAFSWPPCSLS